MEPINQLEQVAQEPILRGPMRHKPHALRCVGRGNAPPARRQRGRLPERRVREHEALVALQQRRVPRQRPERAGRQRAHEPLQGRTRYLPSATTADAADAAVSVGRAVPREPDVHGGLEHERLDARNIRVLPRRRRRRRAGRALAALGVTREVRRAARPPTPSSPSPITALRAEHEDVGHLRRRAVGRDGRVLELRDRRLRDRRGLWRRGEGQLPRLLRRVPLAAVRLPARAPVRRGGGGGLGVAAVCEEARLTGSWCAPIRPYLRPPLAEYVAQLPARLHGGA